MTPHKAAHKSSDAERAERHARLIRFFNARDRLCVCLGIRVTEIGEGTAVAEVLRDEDGYFRFLDRYSLALQRPVTVPLVKNVLQSRLLQD